VVVEETLDTSTYNPTNQVKSEFMKFIFDYDALTCAAASGPMLKKAETKRRRNKIPTYELCTANRANGEQCTRRKKIPDCANPSSSSHSSSHSQQHDVFEFCGTHLKGTPNGIIKTASKPIIDEKINIWVADIGGINYYIDNNHNVYHTDDVLKNKHSPRIISKWTKNDIDVYTISS